MFANQKTILNKKFVRCIKNGKKEKESSKEDKKEEN